MWILTEDIADIKLVVERIFRMVRWKKLLVVVSKVFVGIETSFGYGYTQLWAKKQDSEEGW